MDSSHLPLSGRVAIVTGAAGDLGAAIAGRFLLAGASVAWLDRNQAEAEARIGRGPCPERSLALGCDVADAGSSRQAVEAAVAHFGALHVLSTTRPSCRHGCRWPNWGWTTGNRRWT